VTVPSQPQRVLKTILRISSTRTIRSTRRSTPNTSKWLPSELPPPPSLSLSLPHERCRIEKDYHHVRANIASQREKTAENYRREHDKAINRQNDLNKQLENMEERFKVRLPPVPPLVPFPCLPHPLTSLGENERFLSEEATAVC
jgi:hypothetical protein